MSQWSRSRTFAVLAVLAACRAAVGTPASGAGPSAPLAPPVAISCGSANVPSDNTGASLVDSYSCTAGTYPMGEAYYRFQPTSRVIATATVSDALGYDVFGYREADGPTACIGWNDAAVTLVNLTPDSWLFSLDSTTSSGATGLSLACTDLLTAPLLCGQTAYASTGLTRILNNYTCLAKALNGDETYFVFQNPVTQSFTVAVSGVPAGRDVDVLVFRGPFNAARPSCIAGGNDYARVLNAPPGEYLVVLDAANNATNVPFAVTLACNPVPFSCAGPDLACNTVLPDDTATGTLQELVYGSLAEVYSGREKIYRFVNPVQQSVQFLLRNPSSDKLDLLLLDACDPTALRDWGEDALIEPSLPAGTYYVVVDGRDATQGTYDLVTMCGGPRLEPPVLTADVPPGTCVTEDKTLYYPTTVAEGDAIFSFDLSGSMGQELDQMKANARQIYTEVNQVVPSLRFGLASFVEYAQPYIDLVCGVSHTPSAPNPFPYRLNQPLTPDIATVDATLQTINLVGGAKETYSYTFYQSYTDPNIGWRPCARHLWINFGDEVPVDCNVYECTGGTRNTGRDPGPDLIVGTADDILLLPTVDTMASKGINLIHIDSSENAPQIAMWDCLARRTGGQAFVTDRNGRIPDGTDIVHGIVGVIKDTLRRCPDLRLTPTGPYASWATVSPASYPGTVTPFVGDFQVTFCVPAGTPAGVYSIPVEANCICAGPCAVQLLATQSVEITVPPLCDPAPTAGAAASPGAICAGQGTTLDGTASTACGASGLEYRWLDGATEVCPWSTSPSCPVQPAATTTYTLEVRCRNLPPPGCEASDTVTVEVVPVPAPALAPLRGVCAGEAVTLDASASDSRGCPVALEYQFREGATVLRPWAPSPTYGPIVPAATTSYTVDVRCPAAAVCAAATSQPLTVVPLPGASAGNDVTVCWPRPVTLDGGGSTTTGCPGGALFEWRQGATVVRPASPDPTWRPPTDRIGTITYTLVVRCVGPPPCESADTVAVTVEPCLAVTFDAFAARWGPAGVEVSWHTAWEEDSLYFVVERAGNEAGDFVPVGNVVATGSGSSYALADRGAPAGSRPWYRVVEYTDHGRGDATAAFPASDEHGPQPAPADRGRERSGSRRVR